MFQIDQIVGMKQVVVALVALDGVINILFSQFQETDHIAGLEHLALAAEAVFVKIQPVIAAGLTHAIQKRFALFIRNFAVQQVFKIRKTIVNPGEKCKYFR